ncbi:MAG: DUF2797 domain-containing protein [Bacteroidota bacterium]|nr:DUF2797 domain-containing protein [Bacteroidota bacterium]
MKTVQGIADKMLTEANSPISYKLPLGKELIDINPLIGKEIELIFDGNIYCKSCGSKTKKSFGQGYCYPCFTTIPQTAPCIINPEKCEAHKGIYRDKEFAERVCLQPHYVYLAISSGLKVGVTRATQIPTRWIDQGAVKAMKLAKTPNRHLAGVIEVALKKHMNDKTSWQKMLKNDFDSEINLSKEKEKAKTHLDQELKKFITFDKKIISLSYPIKDFPKTVKSINLDNEKQYTGVLKGIKGQYLIFEDDRVINIRKYGGYELTLKY